MRLGKVWVCAVWLFAAFLGGCATTPPPEVRTDIIDPKAAGRRSAAIVPDQFMNDKAVAKRIADSVGRELAAKGFKVRDAEGDAELVVIATLARSRPTRPAAPRPVETGSTTIGQDSRSLAGMTGSRTVEQNLRPLDGAVVRPAGTTEVGLMISAVRKEDWFSSAAAEGIPKVWRIIVVAQAGRDGREDVTARLVEAAGSGLDQVVSSGSAGGPAPKPR